MEVKQDAVAFEFRRDIGIQGKHIAMVVDQKRGGFSTF